MNRSAVARRPTYVGNVETARKIADEFLGRFPDRRVRIRYWSTQR